MLKVVIKKRSWLRGDNNDSQLYRTRDRKMCCIGFLARTLGCKVSDIKGRGTLNDVPNEKAENFNETHSHVLEEAYVTNDDPDMVEKDRISQLKALGKSMGVRFVFE